MVEKHFNQMQDVDEDSMSDQEEKFGRHKLYDANYETYKPVS